MQKQRNFSVLFLWKMGGENIEVVNKFTLIVILIVFFCCCFKRDFFKFVSMPQIISICKFFSVTRVFSIPTIIKVIAVLLDFDKRVTNLDSISKWWRHVAWCKYKIYLRKGHESRRKKQFWFKTSFQHILVVLKYFFYQSRYSNKSWTIVSLWFYFSFYFGFSVLY